MQLLNRKSLLRKHPYILACYLFGTLALLVGAASAGPTPSAPLQNETTTTAAAALTTLPIQVIAAIIPLHDDMIDDVTTQSLERRAEAAIATGANTLIIELNTPGGMVSSSVDSARYLRNLSENRGIRSIAWVRDEAISGGTMIAMGADQIIMSGVSTIGDVGVIMMGPGGAETAQDPALDAKVESYVLAIFDSAASHNGYDRLLCEAFVRHEIEVWWVENQETGERRFVTPEMKDELLGKSAEAQSNPDSPWRLITTYIDPKDGKEKVLPQPVDSGTRLLTMDQSMAQVLGFSKKIVRDETELKAYLGISASTDIPRLERVWSEDLVSWLTSPIVRAILIAMIGLGAYAEFHTPGLGLAGLVALIALALMLGAPYLTGLANIWEIIIVIIGIALIAVELLVIPGFGFLGLTGIGLVLVGLLATFIPETPGPQFLPTFDLPESFEGIKRGLLTLSGGMTIAVVGMITLSRYLPKLKVMQGIMPENPTVASVMIDDTYQGLARVGDIGLAETPLRPAGKARFGSTLVDVVTRGEFLNAGDRIEIVEREGYRVVVARLESNA